MKRTVKQITSLLLTALLILPFFAGISASATGEPAIVASGYCGKPDLSQINNYDAFGNKIYNVEDLEHNLFWTLDEEGTLSVGGTGEMADFFAITAYHEGETSVLCALPWNVNAVKKVVIEEGVESIGAGAFRGGQNITEAEISAGVKSVEYAAFSGCSIDTITLPDSVSLSPFCLRAKNITLFRGDYDRAGRWHLYEGEYADTYNGIGIQTFTITDGAIYIPDGAFYHEAVMKSLIVPASVTNFRWNAFYGCIGLKDIYFFADDEEWETIKAGYSQFLDTGEWEASEDAWGGSLGFLPSVKWHRVDLIDGHYYESFDATEATATEHGFTAGVYCVDTDEWISGHEVIHNTLGEMTVIKEPTETESGECIIVCTVCGESGYYFMDPVTGEPTEDPEHNDPSQQEDNSFFSSIRRMMRTIIDFFLRLFRWLGKK